MISNELLGGARVSVCVCRRGGGGGGGRGGGGGGLSYLLQDPSLSASIAVKM